MAVRENIEADFHVAMMKADQLEEIAKRLSDLSGRQLGSTMQDLSCGWKGDNANAYLKKGAKLQRKIKATSNDLRNVAGELRSAGKKACKVGENI